MYAILDIETTGGNAFTDKITEIAVYLHDGEKVVNSFATLVNPERSIPEFVSRLTGITNTMVAAAPRWQEIAKQVVELTKGKTIVAHNALNDYSFIRHEFRTIGVDFSRDTLCTHILARKFLPGQTSYSLGKLCKGLNIGIVDRHRASDDALATVKLFELILGTTTQETLLHYLKKQEEEVQLPDCIRPEILSSLPTQPGIYYLYNKSNVLLYVGKTTSLRKGVMDFVIKTKGKKGMRIRQELQNIKHEACGNEIIAAIRESEQIKNLKPLYNRQHPVQVKIKIVPGITNVLLVCKGRTDAEYSLLRIQNGLLSGYGFCPASALNDSKKYLQPISQGTHYHGMVFRAIKHRRYEKMITE